MNPGKMVVTEALRTSAMKSSSAKDIAGKKNPLKQEFDRIQSLHDERNNESDTFAFKDYNKLKYVLDFRISIYFYFLENGGCMKKV